MRLFFPVAQRCCRHVKGRKGGGERRKGMRKGRREAEERTWKKEAIEEKKKARETTAGTNQKGKEGGKVRSKRRAARENPPPVLLCSQRRCLLPRLPPPLQLSYFTRTSIPNKKALQKRRRLAPAQRTPQLDQAPCCTIRARCAVQYPSLVPILLYAFGGEAEYGVFKMTQMGEYCIENKQRSRVQEDPAELTKVRMERAVENTRLYGRQVQERARRKALRSEALEALFFFFF